MKNSKNHDFYGFQYTLTYNWNIKNIIKQKTYFPMSNSKKDTTNIWTLAKHKPRLFDHSNHSFLSVHEQDSTFGQYVWLLRTLGNELDCTHNLSGMRTTPPMAVLRAFSTFAATLGTSTLMARAESLFTPFLMAFSISPQ